ncbi:MAG: hypothetical protein ABWZ08_09440 [Pseudoxanthomonas sp.]
MKPAVFNHLRLTLAVLVLAAAAVDLLLPSPHCKDPSFDSESIFGSGKGPDTCVGLRPATVDGHREP